MALHVVTGATGFLGKHLIRTLLSQNNSVCAIVRKESLSVFRAFHDTLASDVQSKIRVFVGNIREPRLGLDAETLRILNQEEVYFWHLAANLSFQQTDRDQIFADNKGGSEHVVSLINQLPKVQRLLYVSTAYVSGDCEVFREDAPLEQNQRLRNAYEQSKYAAEQHVRAACHKPVTIFRPSIIIGDAYEGKALGCTFGYYRFAFVFYTFKKWLEKKAAQPQSIMRKLLGISNFSGNDVVRTKRLVLLYPQACKVNLVPVDFVVESMVALAKMKGGLQTYHLTHPSPPTFESLFQTLLADLKIEGVHLIPVPPSIFRIVVHILHFFCIPWRKYLDSAKKYLPYITINYCFASERLDALGLIPPDISPAYMHKVNKYAIEYIFSNLCEKVRQ